MNFDVFALGFMSGALFVAVFWYWTLQRARVKGR